MARLMDALFRSYSAVKKLPISQHFWPLWCGMTACLPLDLTRSDSTHFVNIELTSRCNLKCVYCGKSSAGKPDRTYDFPAEWIAPSMETLRRRGLFLLSMHGTGESTTRKGWEVICQSLLDQSFNLMIISNFARPLTAEGIAALARMSPITVSVDTADPVLYSRIRRGAQLETVLTNIKKVP